MAIQRHLNWHLSSTPPTLPALRTLNLQHWQLNPLMPLSAFAFHSAAFGLELEFEFCFSFLFAYLGCSQLSLSLANPLSISWLTAFGQLCLCCCKGKSMSSRRQALRQKSRQALKKSVAYLWAQHAKALKSVAYLWAHQTKTFHSAICQVMQTIFYMLHSLTCQFSIIMQQFRPRFPLSKPLPYYDFLATKVARAMLPFSLSLALSNPFLVIISSSCNIVMGFAWRTSFSVNSP